MYASDDATPGAIPPSIRIPADFFDSNSDSSHLGYDSDFKHSPTLQGRIYIMNYLTHAKAAVAHSLGQQNEASSVDYQ